MDNKQVVLECKRVKFYDPYDEDAFFEWAKKIKCIKNIGGVGDKILLSVDYDTMNDEELYALAALFRRYKVNTKQLEDFLNTNHRDLFFRYKDCYSINVYPAQRE